MMKSTAVESPLAPPVELLYKSFDNVPFSVAVLRGPDLIIDYINQHNLDIWQLNRDEAVGKPLFEVRPDIRKDAEPLHRKVYETGSRLIVREAPMALITDGQTRVRYFDVVLEVARDSKGDIVGQIATSTEVTAQVLARRKAEENETRLRLAIDAGNLGTYEVDLINQTIIYNDRLAIIFGLDPTKKWSHLDLRKRLHPEDVEIRNKAHEIANVTGSLSYEARVVWDDGSHHWIRLNGRVQFNGAIPDRLYGTAIDVTEEKNMALRVIASEEKYRSLFETMEQGFCIIEMIFDDQNRPIDYRFLELNSVFEKHTGLKNALGKTARQLLPDLESRWFELYGNVALTGESARFYEGSEVMERWFDVYAFRIGNEKSRRVALLFSDISERKNSEEVLKRTYERFELINRATQDAIWDWNLETNQVLWNEAVTQLFGYYKDEIGALSDWWIEHLHPDDQDRVHKSIEEVINSGGHNWTDEYRFLCKNGTYKTVLDRGFILHNEQGRPVRMLGSMQDITVRKETEEALRESEERFQNLIRNADVGIVLLAGKEMKVQIVNDAYGRLIASEVHELLGKPLFSMFPEGEELYRPILEKVLDTGEAIYLHDTPYMVKKDGSTIQGFLNLTYQPYRDRNGNIAGVLALCQDVTESVKARWALAESESRFRTLAETLPQLVWMTDAQGEQQYASVRWEQYSGIHPANQSSWIQVIHPEDLERVGEAWLESLTNGKTYKIELRLRSKTGDYRWFFGHAEPIRNKAGQIAKWIGSFTDIHEQKMLSQQLELQVNERTKELAHANRELQRSNEDLQQFAHVASHDLKEPVRKIMTFVSRLRDELESELQERSKDYLSKVDKAALRMYSMIDGVLVYSSLDALQQTRELVDLNETLDNVCDDLEITISEKHALLEYENLPSIEGSSILLYQLFYNLVGNSLKFSRRDVTARISVTSGKISEEEAKRLQLEGQKNYYKIIVSDNGIGFDAEDASRIFGTFTRLHSKDRFEGTGLGLALCKKIVERHGGVIWAESKPGEGASFIIVLPE